MTRSGGLRAFRILTLILLAAELLTVMPAYACTTCQGYLEPFTAQPNASGNGNVNPSDAAAQDKFYPSFGINSFHVNTANSCTTGIADTGGSDSFFNQGPETRIGKPPTGAWELDIDACASRACSPCTGSAPGGYLQTGNGGAGFIHFDTGYLSSGTNVGTSCGAASVNPTDTSQSITVHYVYIYDGNAPTGHVSVTAVGYPAASCVISCGACTSYVGGPIITFRNSPGHNPTCSPGPICDSSGIVDIAWNINDGHTFKAIGTSSKQNPVEFSNGIKSFVVGLGFVSGNSQTFFSLILIALAEIGGSFFSRFLGEGMPKNWLIHTTGSLVGVFCVIIGFLPFWEFVLAVFLASILLKGPGQLYNTFKGLASYRNPFSPSASGDVAASGGEAVDIDGSQSATVQTSDTTEEESIADEDLQ